MTPKIKSALLWHFNRCFCGISVGVFAKAIFTHDRICRIRKRRPLWSPLCYQIVALQVLQTDWQHPFRYVRHRRCQFSETHIPSDMKVTEDQQRPFVWKQAQDVSDGTFRVFIPVHHQRNSSLAFLSAQAFFKAALTRKFITEPIDRIYP